jgi:hypothetical protein
VLARVALICLVAVVFVASCGGGDPGDDVVLAKSSFKEVVTSALRKAGFDAQQRFGLKVRVEDGANWVELVLDGPFAAYRREPDRRREIVAGLVRQAERRLADGVAAASFAEVRESIMPLLKPRFALRGLETKPAQTSFLGGLVVIYAVEREHDFTIVSRADARRWRTSAAQLHELALGNLLVQTNDEQRLLCEERLCGWASGDGYDATRMLVPELRRQIEREIGRAIYAVPMEHVFVALPFRTATRKNTIELLRTKVLRDFTTADNPVSPALFVEQNGELALYT